MKKLILSAMVAMSPLCMASLALAEQPADSDSAHPGAYVKDSVITTKVKTKLAAKHLATLTNIKVDTDSEGVVWLSGKAPSENEGACGMCVDCDSKNPEDWKDMGELMSCWVECSEAYCKASYVIEDEEGLRVSLTLPANSHSLANAF